MARKVIQGPAEPVYPVDPITGTVGTPILDTDGNPITATQGVVLTDKNRLDVAIGPTDPVSDLPVIIEFPHHQVHEGEMYSCSYIISSLNSGVSVIFRLSVPNTYSLPIRAPHIVGEVISTLETELYFYEGTTFSAPGTAQSTYNRNRNISAGPGMLVYLSPTVSAAGTLLWIGLTGSSNKAGAADRSLTEWILRPNTEYSFVITSRANGDKIVVRFDWYEDAGV